MGNSTGTACVARHDGPQPRHRQPELSRHEDMPSAVIIPFPGPRGRASISDDSDGLRRFVERYLRTRRAETTPANCAIVMRAITHFPGGLPARRMDIERFIDYSAGPRLRRLPRVLISGGKLVACPAAEPADSEEGTL